MSSLKNNLGTLGVGIGLIGSLDLDESTSAVPSDTVSYDLVYNVWTNDLESVQVYRNVLEDFLGVGDMSIVMRVKSDNLFGVVYDLNERNSV